MKDPNKEAQLSKYVKAAKHVIYDADRAEKLLSMMDTGQGAIKAVQTVAAIIDRKYPIPNQIAALFGMNIYLLLVSMAQELTGQKPDTKVLIEVSARIMNRMYSMTEQKKKPAIGLIGA